MQKFQKGDLVHIAKDLGRSMRHFTADVDAIVLGSYSDKFEREGASSDKEYALYLKGSGESSWYEEHQLTLIEHRRFDLLQKWEREVEGMDETYSDIDWIFDNGDDVLEDPPPASIEALANALGCDNLWGPNNESIDYCNNADVVMKFAAPFIETGDKDGWLKFSEDLKAAKFFG